MNSPRNDAVLPVVCNVCGTRSYARPSQVGQTVVCPDCDARLLVKPLAAPAAKPVRIDPDLGDEYSLAPESESVARPASPERSGARGKEDATIKVVCRTCFTLMHATADQIGHPLRCPDCGSQTVVPRPAARATRFVPPSADELTLESGPPPAVDEKKKEIADRLMAEATDHVRRIEAERPTLPTSPLSSGILAFPLTWRMLPFLGGLTGGVLVDLMLLNTVHEMINSIGWSSILAAFLVPVASLITAALAGLAAPVLLTVVEMSAEGWDRIPYWPSVDLLGRIRAVTQLVNAIAVASAPGMLFFTLLRATGWSGSTAWGMITTPFLLPPVLLSLLYLDSAFIPYAPEIFRSLRTLRWAWEAAYLQIVGVGIGVAAACWIAFRLPLGTVLIVACLCWYAVFFMRLLGRLALVISTSMLATESSAE